MHTSNIYILYMQNKLCYDDDGGNECCTMNTFVFMSFKLCGITATDSISSTNSKRPTEKRR